MWWPTGAYHNALYLASNKRWGKEVKKETHTIGFHSDEFPCRRPLTGFKLLSLPDGASKMHPSQEKERES